MAKMPINPQNLKMLSILNHWTFFWNFLPSKIISLVLFVNPSELRLVPKRLYFEWWTKSEWYEMQSIVTNLYETLVTAKEFEQKKNVLQQQAFFSNFVAVVVFGRFPFDFLLPRGRVVVGSFFLPHQFLVKRSHNGNVITYDYDGSVLGARSSHYRRQQRVNNNNEWSLCKQVNVCTIGKYTSEFRRYYFSLLNIHNAMHMFQCISQIYVRIWKFVKLQYPRWVEIQRAGVRWHEFKQTKRNMLCVRVTDAKKIRFDDTCLMHDSSKLKPLCTAVLHSSIAF